ncbi:heavy metal-responsive transcriptional regulator [Ornithinimicrobium cavernae]|uniref:heavy metal-responsive transcriptional regulator n=1 Tax=Ornithinimicrobium cavernae TaxID=2666047 RepID=UPI000D69E3C5|nr:heavy metal-responsive transcriptional regulator [Ornithinimicrobium cavernae]
MNTTTVPRAANPTPERLRIGQLARAAGVSTDTIRYYEREGLLPAPERTSSGYREYGPGTADRLAFIQGCQRLGLRLTDIGDLLAIRDTGVCPCEPAEQHLRRRIAEVDAELERLTLLRAQMSAMVQTLPSDDCAPPPGSSWCPPHAEGGD